MTAVDVLESCGWSVALNPSTINRKVGTLALGKDSTNASEQILEAAQKQVREEYLAVQFLIEYDLWRYKKLVEEVENAYTGGNRDSYLTTVNQAYEMLVRYKNNPRNHSWSFSPRQG